MPEKENKHKNSLICPKCDTYRYLEINGTRFTDNNKSLGIKIPYFKCKTCETSTAIAINQGNKTYDHDRAMTYYQDVANIHFELMKEGEFFNIKNNLENIIFENFSSIGFNYDSLDYYYIPGLIREWNDGLLTPVFFNKELLLYYNSSPDYRVTFASTSRFHIFDSKNDKLIQHGFGINRNGNIICWLGDLEKELNTVKNKLNRNLFLTFNIDSDHDIVSDYYTNQIEGGFTSSDNESGVFYHRNEFDKRILEKHGFEITQIDINNLIKEYKHPILNEQNQIDNSYVKLNSLLIESLNVVEIKKKLIENGVTTKSIKGLGGLKLFQKFIEIILNKSEYSKIISPLFVLYDLRLLAGHIKDSNYESKLKSCKDRLGLLENVSLIEIQQTLCIKLIEMYKELNNN
jgi:hypothetical protein